MERKEVISGRVMREVFQSQQPADCFCGCNIFSTESSFQFSSDVLTYIETAVAEKLQRKERS